MPYVNVSLLRRRDIRRKFFAWLTAPRPSWPPAAVMARSSCGTWYRGVCSVASPALHQMSSSTLMVMTAHQKLATGLLLAVRLAHSLLFFLYWLWMNRNRRKCHERHIPKEQRAAAVLHGDGSCDVWGHGLVWGGQILLPSRILSAEILILLSLKVTLTCGVCTVEENTWALSKLWAEQLKMSENAPLSRPFL